MAKEGKRRNVREYFWFAIFVTNIIAILLLLGSTQAWNFAPSKAILFSFLGMGFPIFIIINILYLIFWIFALKWQYALAEVLVLLVCWTPMQTYMPINERSEYIPEESFKLLSYNVRHFNVLGGKGARENPIFDYILEQEPDIICFQEFGAGLTKTAKGLISKDEIDKKFKDYKYNEFIQLGNPNAPTLYGLAIYSKFPIKRTEEIIFWSTFNGAVLHEIEIYGKTVSLFNVHLESNRITSDDKKLYKDFIKSGNEITLKEVGTNIKGKLSAAYTTREGQVQLIDSYVQNQKTDATIICGDFNDTPISYAYRTMKGDLIDSYATTGRGVGITYHENMFLFRIDYIFHSITLKSYNTTVGNKKYSDHYPVWTNLMFK